MKKIMFNEKFGLETAVLNGTKTMTRRHIPIDMWNRIDFKAYSCGDDNCAEFSFRDNRWGDWRELAPYKVGDVVAIAQPYSVVAKDLEHLKTEKGWNNKMFVRAALMVHQIEITDVKMEKLQDITDEECIKEGIFVQDRGFDDNIYNFIVNGKYTCNWRFPTARDAFAALIDKLSGKGTWDKNEYVLAYTFKLIK